MMTKHEAYAIVVLPLSEEDGGGFYGFAPDLPGCASDGETQEEAVKNTLDAMHEWLYEQELRGVEVPKPGSSAQAAIDRERKLLDAVRSLAEYRDEADEKINSLETQLAEIIALLKDDRGHLPLGFTATLATQPNKKKLPH